MLKVAASLVQAEAYLTTPLIRDGVQRFLLVRDDPIDADGRVLAALHESFLANGVRRLPLIGPDMRALGRIELFERRVASRRLQLRCVHIV